MPRSSPLKHITGYQVVSHRQVEKKEYVVLLEKDGLFAVCRTQPDRDMALTTNYGSSTNGVLTAPLNPRGLNDLLFWSDKHTADRRFSELLTERGLTPVRLHLVS